MNQGKRSDQIRTSEKILFFAWIGLITTIVIAFILKSIQ